MRIALYSDHLYWHSDPHSVRWAKMLQKEGHEVHLFSNWGKKLKGEDFVHTVLAPFGWHVGVSATQLKRSLLKFMPDVVICVGDTPSLRIGTLKKTFPNVIGVVCGTKKLTRKLLANYRQADVVISDTFMLQGILLALGGSSKVEVISKSISLETKHDPAARLLLRRKMGADENTVVVLCKQPLRMGFSHAYLMECFACVNKETDAQLWMVGQGPAAWLLKAYAHILDRKRIKIIAPEFAPSYYYSAADAAATASGQEDISDFLIDAHAFGLPAVCENHGGCAEVVMNGLSGWVSPPKNEPFFVGALQEMIRNPSLRKMMGQNARSLSFRFDPHRQQQQLLKLLAALAG